MHSTLEKFGYPTNTIMETESWCVLLRPSQVTLGSMVLVSKNDEARSLAQIPEMQFGEIPSVCEIMETAVRDEFDAQKFNYLALMMVDPHVHFHVIPRYGASISFLDCEFEDANWPGPPDLTSTIDVSADLFAEIRKRLEVRASTIVSSRSAGA